MSGQENKLVDLKKAVVQSLHLPLLLEKEVQADVLRLDAIHPVISGNKWFKMKYFLEECSSLGHDTMLTMGGAFSNHIIATAYLCSICGFQSIGLIRGEKPPQLSHTLQQAREYGMRLHFISRDLYRQKNSIDFVKATLEKFGHVYLVPEGGAGANGIRGSREILGLCPATDYTHIMAAIGTGTMFTGLVESMPSGVQLIGIPVLKGMNSNWVLPDDLTNMHQNQTVKIFSEYHLGGYAKKSEALIRFMNSWYSETGIPSDFVYTGKLFYAFNDLLHKQYFPQGSKVLLIHSGGLQGNLSLAKTTLLF